MISDQLKNTILKQIDQDLESLNLDNLIDQQLESFYLGESTLESLEALENTIIDQAIEEFNQKQGSEDQYYQKIQQQILATAVEKKPEPVVAGKQPAKEAEGREPGTAEPESLPQLPPQPTELTDDQYQALQRTRQNEAAWIQGSVIHQLFAAQGIDPNSLPPGLRDQIFQEVWDELQGYDQTQLKDLFANTTARSRLLQKTYGALGQNLLFTTYLTELAATNPALAEKIGQALQTTPGLVLPDTIFNQIRSFYDLSIEPHLAVANIENFSYSIITTAALQQKNPYAYIDSLTTDLIAVHFGIQIPAGTDLDYFKTILKSYVYVESLKLTAEDILPDQTQTQVFVEGTQAAIETDEALRLQSTLKSLSIQRGIEPHLFIDSVYSKYGDIRQQLTDEVLSREEFGRLYKKQFIILNYYQNLDAAQKEAAISYFEGVQPGRVSLTGQQFNFPPASFSPADFIQTQTDQPPARGGLFNRLSSLGRRKKESSLKDKAFAGLELVGTAATATAADVILPGAGMIFRGLKAVSDLLAKLGIQKRFQWAGLAAGLAAAAGLVIRFLISHPLATAFGAGGMLLGGPILAIPAFGLGYLLEDGAKKLYGSINNAFSSAADTIKGGFESILGTKSASASALPVTGALGLVTSLAIANNIFTQGAFLQPLPTIDDQGEISPYVTIEKVAHPGINFSEYTEENFPDTTITYAIRISPKEDYSITITSMADVISTNFNSELKPDTEIATETVAEVAEFFGQGPVTINPGEELVLPAYQRTYGANYLHSNVSNNFEIKFTVDSGGAEIIDGEQTAKTAEVICFGECPQFQNGCWPTDGIIYTEPYAPNLNTHRATDAFDISGNAGAPVFAIFDGTAYFYQEGTGIFAGAANGAYGNHIFIISQDAEGKAFALIYAHLNSLAMSQGPHEISAGTYLGDVGSTGNSEGPHLHFEVRTDVADYTSSEHAPNFYHAINNRFTINQIGPTGLPEPYYTAPNYEAPIAGTRVRPTLLDRLTPEGNGENGLTVLFEAVRTCYER